MSDSDLLQAFLNIGKALQCPICLSVMRDPARLKCCHYFCHSCLSRVLEKDKAPCPVCKAPAHRRDATRDPTLLKLTDNYRTECERAHLTNLELGIVQESNVEGEEKVQEQEPAKTMRAGASSRREKKPSPQVIMMPPPSNNKISRKIDEIPLSAACHKAKKGAKRGRGKAEQVQEEEEEVAAVVAVAPSAKKPKTAPPATITSTPLPAPAFSLTLPPPVTTGTKARSGPSKAGPSSAAPSSSLLLVPPPSEGRRIPSRLLPWACPRCTLHNQGTSNKCQVCKLKRSEAKVMAQGASQQGQGQGGEGEGDRLPFDPQPPVPVIAHLPLPVIESITGAMSMLEEEEEEGGGAARVEEVKHSPLVPGKRQAPPPSPLRLSSWGEKAIQVVGSGLGPGQITLLRKLTDQSGSKFLDAFPSPPPSSSIMSFGAQRVTHVICHVNENGRAKRTIKYLLGICHGCWVVSMAWAEACVREKLRVEEEPYLIVGDMAGGEGGVRLGLEVNSKGPCRLLNGLRVVLQGPFTAKNDIVQLVRAAGGVLLPRPPPPSPSLAPKSGSKILPPSSSSFLPESALDEGGSMMVVKGTPHPQPEPSSMLNSQRVVILVDLSAQQPNSSSSTRGLGKGKERGLREEEGDEVYSYKWLLDSVGSMKMRDMSDYRV